MSLNTYAAIGRLLYSEGRRLTKLLVSCAAYSMAEGHIRYNPVNMCADWGTP
jgi:hypothetical protein